MKEKLKKIHNVCKFVIGTDIFARLDCIRLVNRRQSVGK